MHSTSVRQPRCLQRGQVRQGDAERLVRVVAVAADLVGADEVHQHVLVGQRDAEVGRPSTGPVTVERRPRHARALAHRRQAGAPPAGEWPGTRRPASPSSRGPGRAARARPRSESSVVPRSTLPKSCHSSTCSATSPGARRTSGPSVSSSMKGPAVKTSTLLPWSGYVVLRPVREALHEDGAAVGVGRPALPVADADLLRLRALVVAAQADEASAEREARIAQVACRPTAPAAARAAGSRRVGRRAPAGRSRCRRRA